MLGAMRIGLVLPTFRADGAQAVDAFFEIEDRGFDGAFVYDHLWPMYHRDQPAISAFAVLGALGARRRAAVLGTLVARVGVVETPVLVRQLITCYEVCDGAFIAGVGTGDHKSKEELVGYGLTYANADVRRAEMRSVLHALTSYGVPAWVGGGAQKTNEIAWELEVTLNLWGKSPEAVGLEARRGAVSWAGKLPSNDDDASALLVELHRAGASWAVFDWPGSLGGLQRACVEARMRLA